MREGYDFEGYCYFTLANVGAQLSKPCRVRFPLVQFPTQESSCSGDFRFTDRELGSQEAPVAERRQLPSLRACLQPKTRHPILHNRHADRCISVQAAQVGQLV